MTKFGVHFLMTAECGPITREKLAHIHVFFSLAETLLSRRWRTNPGACPTNDISIKFEIRPKFAVLWFKTNSVNHNEILHTSRQCNCRDVCKILLWSVEHILNYSTPISYQISNSIKIPLVGQAPGRTMSLERHYIKLQLVEYQVSLLSLAGFQMENWGHN